MRSPKTYLVLLALLVVSGRAQDELSQEEVDALVGVWKATKLRGLRSSDADAAFKQGVESVDGDLETYPWEQVNAQAFSSEVPPGDVIVVVAGVDPASGLEWGYSYTSMPGEGPQLNRFGGVARTQADGSILQTFVSSESTATSFRTLRDGKLYSSWLQGVEVPDTTPKDPNDVVVSQFERVEGAEAAKILMEVAALLPLEGAEGDAAPKEP